MSVCLCVCVWAGKGRRSGRTDGRTGCIQNEYPHSVEWWEKRAAAVLPPKGVFNKILHPFSFLICLMIAGKFLKDPNRRPLRSHPRATRVRCRKPPKKVPRRPRRLQDAFKFSSFFGCLFGSILAPFSLPTWSPKSRKIDQKSMPRWLPMLTSFLDRFFLEFYSQLGPSEPHLELAG